MTSFKNRLDVYEQLLHLQQPSSFLLLLWPSLLALWVAAAGRPSLSLIIIFVMGALLMAAAGHAFSDWVNRDAGHPDDQAPGLLARGIIAPWEAPALAAALSLLAFCFIGFTTRFAMGLSVVALLLAMAFPFLKRFPLLSFVFFVVIFSFGIPLAFAAINNMVPWYGWALMGINGFWAVACGAVYAIARRADNHEPGKFSAILSGRYTLWAIAVCYGLYLAGMLGAGLWLRLGIAYWLALTLAASGVIALLRLIRNRDPERCRLAFHHGHWLVMIIFIGFVADAMLRLHALPIWTR